MSDDDYREVYRALREAQTRYSYFLLAAAGAAIGVAVTQTQTATIEWNHLGLGAAVICWGLSFFFGCRHLANISSGLYANAELLRLQAGEHPLAGGHQQAIHIGVNVIVGVLEKMGTRAQRNGVLQFLFLIAGAVFYLVWHVWQMFLRTTESPLTV